MNNRRNFLIALTILGLAGGGSAFWLYAEQIDDEHEALYADRVEVVKAAQSIDAGTRLRSTAVTTESVPRKFLPPNPLLRTELDLYLKIPLAVNMEAGQIVRTSDFSHGTLPEVADSPGQFSMTGRLVIKSADLSLESSKPKEVAGKLTSLTERSGGYVVSSTVYGSAAKERATITARVPAARFDSTLSAFRNQGTVTREEIEGTDVTEKFIDLDAQARNQRRLEARLLNFLDTASNIKEALKLEEEIARVRTSADQLEGRSKRLHKNDALSTIHVTVAMPAAAPAPDPERSMLEPIHQAFTDSVRIMVSVTSRLIRVVAAATPFLLFFGPIGYAGYALRSAQRPPR